MACINKIGRRFFQTKYSGIEKGNIPDFVVLPLLGKNIYIYFKNISLGEGRKQGQKVFRSVDRTANFCRRGGI